jgi:hypothetical protein
MLRVFEELEGKGVIGLQIAELKKKRGMPQWTPCMGGGAETTTSEPRIYDR